MWLNAMLPLLEQQCSINIVRFGWAVLSAYRFLLLTEDERSSVFRSRCVGGVDPAWVQPLLTKHAPFFRRHGAKLPVDLLTPQVERQHLTVAVQHRGLVEPRDFLEFNIGIAVIEIEDQKGEHAGGYTGQGEEFAEVGVLGAPG